LFDLAYQQCDMMYGAVGKEGNAQEACYLIARMFASIQQSNINHEL
jgi:hypothetical protein